MDFRRQTFVSSASWNKGELTRFFGGQKVKGQVHGMTTFAKKGPRISCDNGNFLPVF